ncbi:ribonuclease M5 [Alteribacter natronophilus]|uniref:ribonuclease M5 n=1 Tax=Alteribacter natronophilus TaxID=2583810 RepID=UPI00110E5D5D|nr:ribonuclease M5 [Alteribacter natronophilus]TMW69965.1 ribonuclease M5 [Alteribacter natronophilus]
MIIKEMIVVEGRDDTKALRRVAECDTIETNGSAVDAEVIEKIKLAAERRGVIIFTDPDAPGEKIRRTVEQHVPGCRHAFLSKDEARSRRGAIGVEHASPEALLKALADVRTAGSRTEEYITKNDLMSAGLIAGPGSREKRERVGKLLRIGYANGKQLHRRLIEFRISRGEFAAALKTAENEAAAERTGKKRDL